MVFQDGLQLHRNAPRPWKEPGTASAIKDLLDGYFPMALKKEFPDGVPLKVRAGGMHMWRRCLGTCGYPSTIWSTSSSLLHK